MIDFAVTSGIDNCRYPELHATKSVFPHLFYAFENKTWF